jgi:YesN/AraC family two-component response regulator
MASASSPITVMTVDDHPLIREGIAAVLSSEPDLSLVAEASDGREAIECFRRHHPDITLMDLQMPEMKGIDAIIAIRREFRKPALSCSRHTRATCRPSAR